VRVEILGCPVDILTMGETVDLARRAMREKIMTRHVALNVAKLVNMRTDPLLASDVSSSDLIGIDGMGIVVAARLLGLPTPERVAGIDLFYNLMAVCAAEGFRPFFLGGTEAVVQQAVRHFSDRYPALAFAGMRNGYFSQDQEAEIVEEIRESGADCLFLGMPTPRKERFLSKHASNLGVPFIMGVGGSFDIASGLVRRAPTRVQAAGLEWLYRVYQEPRRMWWRYARTNAIFAFMLLEELFRAKSRPSNHHLASTK
jgi:N-acetylglucosaminyldiphosphoundecaprenol N-acetyl-beta-D-mannosaminyltransferase